MGRRSLCVARYTDWFCGCFNLLSSWYPGIFCQGWSGWGRKVISYLLLVLRWRIHGAVLPSCLYAFIVYMFPVPVPLPFLLLFCQLYSIHATLNFMHKSHTRASDSISSPCCRTAAVSCHVRCTSGGMNVRLGGECVQVWFQAGTRHFSLLQNVQTICGADLALYSVGTGSSFPRVKVSGVQSSQYFDI